MWKWIVPVGSELNEGLGHDEANLSLRACMAIGFGDGWLEVKVEPRRHRCNRRNEIQRTTDGTMRNQENQCGWRGKTDGFCEGEKVVGTAEMISERANLAFNSLPGGRIKNGG